MEVCRICLVPTSNPRQLFGRRVKFLEGILGKAMKYLSANSWLCDNCTKMIDTCTAFKIICLKAELFWEKHYEKSPENKSLDSESHEICTEKILPASNEQTQKSASNNDEKCKPVNNYVSFDLEEKNAHNPMPPVVNIENSGKDDPVKIEGNEMPPSGMDDVQFVKTEGGKEHIGELECDFPYDGHHSDDSEINEPLKKIEEKIPENVIEKSTKEADEKRAKRAMYSRAVFDKKNGILVILSLEEQLKELEMSKNDEKFLKAKYKCWDCATYQKKSSKHYHHMRQHLESRGDEVCQVCTRRFANTRELMKHKHFHSKRIICQFCQLKFPVHRFRAHIDEHKGLNNFPCDQCSLLFRKQFLLTQHKRIHHPLEENILRCDHCPKTFIFMGYLRKHMNSHSSNPEHRCEECGKILLNKYYYDVHMLRHQIRKDSYCVECNKQYKNATILGYHYKSSPKHIPQMFKYKCKSCHRVYRTEEKLLRHTENYHEGVKRYTCEICSKEYATIPGLRIHKRHAHMGFQYPLKFECPHCPKKFRISNLLSAHIRTHTGEQPFECELCKRKFSQSGSLRTHCRLVHKKIISVKDKKS